MEFAVRSAADVEQLKSQAWVKLTGDSVAVTKADRVLQYQAIFHSDNGDRYPVLDRVEIQLKSE